MPGWVNYKVIQQRLMSFFCVQTSPLCLLADTLKEFLIARWQIFKVRQTLWPFAQPPSALEDEGKDLWIHVLHCRDVSSFKEEWNFHPQVCHMFKCHLSFFVGFVCVPSQSLRHGWWSFITSCFRKTGLMKMYSLLLMSYNTDLLKRHIFMHFLTSKRFKFVNIPNCLGCLAGIWRDALFIKQ